jgi:hypothetical protein
MRRFSFRTRRRYELEARAKGRVQRALEGLHEFNLAGKDPVTG